jgi:hypothetical protein
MRRPKSLVQQLQLLGMGEGPKRGSNRRTRRQKAQSVRNLKRRLAKPALGNGRTQKACKYALCAGPATLAQVLDYTCSSRIYQHGFGGVTGPPIRRCDKWNTIRALKSVGATETDGYWTLPVDV